MNKRFGKILRTLIILAVTGGLLYLAFRNIDFAEMKEDLWAANFYWVGVSVLLGWLAFVARGLRWLILIDSLGFKAKVWNSIHAVTFGYFANLFVPRAGEIARCTSLNQTDDIPVDKLIGTVIVERVIDFFFLGLFVLASLILQFDNIIAFFQSVNDARSSGGDAPGGASLLTYFAIAAGIGLVILFIFRKRILAMPLFAKIRTFMIGVFEGMKTVYKMKSKGSFIAYTLFIWAAYFGMIYVNFFSIPGLNVLGVADGVTMTVVGGLGMVVPAQGGIGSYHLAVSYGMTVLGQSYGLEETINYQSGLTYATLIHASQTLMILISGAIALFALYLARTKKSRSEA